MLNYLTYKLMGMGFFPNKRVLCFWEGNPIIVDREIYELFGMSILIAFLVGIFVCHLLKKR